MYIYIYTYVYIYTYIYIYIYEFFICCLAALRPSLGQCLGDRVFNPILITAL